MDRLGRFLFGLAVFAVIGLVGGSQVLADPADTGDPVRLFLSSDSSGVVGGVAFQDEDIVSWDSATDQWAMVLDGSAAGVPSSADLNGFHILDPDQLTATSIYLTFQNPTTLPVIGQVDDSDVVALDTATGQFSLVLDGSTVGLTTSSEDIDSIALLGADLVVSTTGSGSVTSTGGGAIPIRDEDLLVIRAGGLFELLIDGSDIDLAGEDISAATIDPATDEIFIGTLGGFSVPGLSGDKDDVPVFTGTTGSATSGTIEPFFDGDDHGFGTEQVDGLSLQTFSPPPPGEADLEITKTDDIDPAQIGDTITYTVEVTNNGPDAAQNVVVADVLPAGTSLVATSGCAQDPNGLPCSLGVIAANTSKSYTVAVSVDTAPPGTITNTAEVSSGTADPNPNNNIVSEDTEIVIAPTAVADGPASNSVPGDPFHGPADTTISSPNLLDNDDLGDPAGTISSFGGGDLGGTVADNAAGSSVSSASGDLTVNANGSFSFDPVLGFNGLFEFEYRLSGPGGDSDTTAAVYIGDRPIVTGSDMIWVSSSSPGTTGGVTYADEDIIVFDAGNSTWEMYFDGSDVGLSSANVNAFHLVDPADPLSEILMSFRSPTSVPGVGTVDDSDVVSFVPSVLGVTTAGSFSLLFDGSANGMSSSAEDIDALSVNDQGDLVMSTTGGSNLPGVNGSTLIGRDEDLVAFDDTTGEFSMHFDGSDVDLGGEDLASAVLDLDSGELYGTALTGFSVTGLSGDHNDVFSFAGTFGPSTAGTYNTFFDGQDLNLTNEQVDGLHVLLNRNEAPVLGGPTSVGVDENTTAVTDYNATDDASSEGSGLSYALIGTVDDGLFTIDPVTGEVAFVTAPDFEDPDDANTDNQYQIVVEVTDAGGLTDSEAVTVTVNDVVETATITIIQDTSPDDAQDFVFTSIGLVPPAFTLDDDGDNLNTHSNTQVFSSVNPGTYTVTQDAVTQWPSLGLGCTPGGTPHPTNPEVSITVAAGDSVTCTFFNTPATADLSITKTDSADPVFPGDSLTYTVEVSNPGPHDATNVVVTDTLPAGVTFVSTSGCAEDTAGVPTCSLGSIAAGGSASYTVEVTVDTGTVGTITNTVSVTADEIDPNLANNSTTEDTLVSVPSADLSITKTDSADPVFPGDSLTYTVEVSNAGPQTATNVVVTDTLPAGVTFVSTSGCGSDDPNGVPTCSLGSIGSGSSVSYTIEVTVDSGTVGTITNSASVSADQGDPNGANNSTTEDTLVSVPSADLSITKTDSADPVAPNGSLTYTVEVSNAGPQTATNVVVTDTLPAGVTFVSTSGCGSDDPNGVPTCSLGSIAAGGSASYTIEVTVDSGTSGTITNSASVSADQGDPNASNNSTTEDTLVILPVLSVTKVDELLVDNDTDNMADPGDTLRYRVLITNGHPTQLTNMVFTDMLDANTTLSGAVHVSPLAFDDSYNSDQTGINIAPGAGLLLNDADPDGTVSNSIVAVNGLPGAVGNPTATSEGGSVTVASNGGFDYTPPNGFDGDDTFTYTLSDGDPLTRDDTETVTITVVQTGNALNAPVFFTGQSVGTASTTLNQSIGLVEPGQVIEVVFDVIVNSPGPASGEVCNQATVTTDSLSPVSSDDPDTAAADDPTCTTIDLPPVTPGSAVDDAYSSIGNVGITVPVVGGVLDNDVNGSVSNNIVGAVQGSPGNVGAGVPTDQGGSITVAANGSFIYTPPVGFEGDDTFTYTIDDGIAGPNPNETATVTITVDEVIWFIEGNRPTQGNGTYLFPFNSIGGTGFATAADEAGDVIFIFDGTSGYSDGITLLNDQKLIGEGTNDPLATAAGILVPTHSFSLPNTSTSPALRPEIAAPSGVTVTLANGNTVRGINVNGSNDTRIAGTNVGTTHLADLTVGLGSFAGIDIDFNGSNAGVLTINNVQMAGNTTAPGTPAAIDIDKIGTGMVHVDMTNSTVTVGTATSRSVELQADDTATMSYDISNNTVNPSNSVAILIRAIGDSTINGQLIGNIVTSAAGVAGGAIQVEAQESGHHIARVQGNTVTLGSDVGGGVRAISSFPTNSGGARVDATIDGNVINIGQNVNFGRGIQLHALFHTVCADVLNNTVNDNSSNTDIGMSVVQDSGGLLFLQDLPAPVNGGGGTPGSLDTLWNSKSNSTNADAGPTFLQGLASPGNCLTPTLP